MSISSNFLSGDFTSDYRDKKSADFRNIENLKYCIHNDFILLDFAADFTYVNSFSGVNKVYT